MANNKLYGYTPNPSKEVEGNRLDRLNPYEFKKGMDYELTSMGCYRLAESTADEREKATESVIKNLQEYGGYYSALIQYETEYRNPIEGISKPSFKAYLKEMEDYHMIEVDKTYSNDKMTEPKYKKEDYTTKFETGKMKDFKLKALKEAIKKEIIKEAEKKKYSTQDDAPKGKGKVAGGCTGNFTQGSCPPGQCCIGGSCGGCRDNPAPGKSKSKGGRSKNEAETGGEEKGNCCYGLKNSDPNSVCCRKIKYGRIKKKSTSKKEAAEKLANLNTPENMQACKAAGSSEKQCLQGFRTNKVPPGATRRAKSGFWCCLFGLKCCKGKPLEPWMRPSFEEGLNEKELIGGKYYRKDTCRCYWSDGSSNSVMCEGDGDGCGNITEGTACEECCNNHGMVAQNPRRRRRGFAMSEAKKDKDVYDMDDELEPSKSQIKGIDKSIGDAKEALAQAIKKVKELGPDIKRLAKETNEKIKKNPAGKADYLKTYTTNPDVKAFIKLRKMLKSADLL